jgi:hypothetical protein
MSRQSSQGRPDTRLIAVIERCKSGCCGRCSTSAPAVARTDMVTCGKAETSEVDAWPPEAQDNYT